MSNPLAWRERAAVADMHCRLAAKKLNTAMMTDGMSQEKLLSELGKALECVQAAQTAIAAARTEVELAQPKRVPFVRGARAPQFGQPFTLGEIAGASK